MSIKKHIIILIFFTITSALVFMGIIDTFGYAYSDQRTLNLLEAKNPSTSPIDEPQFPKLEKSSTVRLYFPDKNKIEHINIEEYLSGVLTAEMYSDSPMEALKAMAVTARTYTLYMCEKNRSKDYDVVADQKYSQAYIDKNSAVEAWNESGRSKYETMEAAVSMTDGEVICYNGDVICALYHASSYPCTESSENVFIEELPYLKGNAGVETEDNAYSSIVRLTLNELNELFFEHGFPLVSESVEIKISRNQNARCEYLHIRDDKVSFIVDGREVRNIFGLRSTSFDVDVKDGVITFNVYGFGHGVGLSQNGAVIMAEGGERYTEIIKEYYPGTEIFKTIYKQ